jgi:hypothetical protein
MSDGLPTLQLRAFIALTAAVAASALLVALLPGAPAALRATLAFRLQPEPASIVDAVGILAANAKAAGVLIAGAALVRGRTSRLIFDVLLTAMLAGNMALVGAALGAYGPDLMPWLVHLPLELAGLAVPAGAYLHARRAGPCPHVLLATTAFAGVLLTVAALVETYLTPHL